MKDKAPRLRPGYLLPGLKVALALLMLMLVLAAAQRLILSHREEQRGIVYGPPPDIPLASAYPLGVNVSLEQYQSAAELERALQLVEDGGFRWIRQHFPWREIEREPGQYEWATWDRLVAASTRHGLQIIAVLDTSPSWARSERDLANPWAPPRNYEDYARFVEAFVSHYRGRLKHLELWDEPNIHPHWGEASVDPAAYTELLRLGYRAAKLADPQAVILSAGLAPNTEAGGMNLSDILFLEGMYQAGAKEHFNVLAIKPYGLWFGPEERAVGTSRLNFPRAILFRETMLRYRDGKKAVWAVEMGWNSLPEGWKGGPSLWGNCSEEEQAARTVAALRRALEEWPWLGVIALQHFQPAVPADDPWQGFALVRKDFSPRPVYFAVQELAAGPPPARPGRYGAEAWPLSIQGDWRMEKGQLVSQRVGDALEVRFQGSRFELLIPKEAGGRLKAILDGKPVAGPSRAAGEGGYFDLARAAGAIALARGLEWGPHHLRLEVAALGPEGHLSISGFVVSREAPFLGYRLSLTLVALILSALLWWLARLLVAFPWRDLAETYRGLKEVWQLLIVGAAFLLFFLPPWFPAGLMGFALLAGLLWLSPHSGLVLVILSIPFYLYAKQLGPRAISITEFLVLLCAGLWLAREGAALMSRGWRGLKEISHARRKFSALDWELRVFLGLSILSVALAQNFGVAVRELRVVVIEPLLFYFLLTRLPLRREHLFRLADALVLAGVMASLHGLYQYGVGGDVIIAEGVRRIRGPYSGPNNLALYLGRVLPLALVGAAFGRMAPRRAWYGLATLTILPGIFLTYSRGAWLLGLPAAVLFVGLMRKRKGVLVALGLLLLVLASLVPLHSAARVASLFNFSQGTWFFRLKLWQASLRMIADHPLFGVGLDNFLYHYPNYMLPEAWQEPNLSHPHNIVLDFWTRLGLGGVILIVLIAFSFFRKGLRLYRHLGDDETSLLALGVMAGMVAALAHGLIDNSYFLVDLAFLFMLMLGLIERLDRLIGLRGIFR